MGGVEGLPSMRNTVIAWVIVRAKPHVTTVGKSHAFAQALLHEFWMQSAASGLRGRCVDDAHFSHGCTCGANLISLFEAGCAEGQLFLERGFECACIEQPRCRLEDLALLLNLDALHRPHPHQLHVQLRPQEEELAKSGRLNRRRRWQDGCDLPQGREAIGPLRELLVTPIGTIQNVIDLRDPDLLELRLQRLPVADDEMSAVGLTELYSLRSRSCRNHCQIQYLRCDLCGDASHSSRSIYNEHGCCAALGYLHLFEHGLPSCECGQGHGCGLGPC